MKDRNVLQYTQNGGSGLKEMATWRYTGQHVSQCILHMTI